jgi:hypothetical protein
MLLQDRFFTLGQTHWYDTAAVTLYFLHFLAPLLVALTFWFIDRPLFKRYMAAMVIVSYLAFITYYLFPAMHPWKASARFSASFGPGNAHRARDLWTSHGFADRLSTRRLHAAFPFMMALFVTEKFPRWGGLAFVYPAAVWLAVVYLGGTTFCPSSSPFSSRLPSMP